MKTTGEQPENNSDLCGPFGELLTAGELAARWKIPTSWVREWTRSRCSDPIPCLRLGRYVRFALSPELIAWWQRRRSGYQNRHKGFT
jgi:hypothetical protein